AVAAHQHVQAVGVGDHVIAALALDEVAGIAGVGDDIVAGPSTDEIDAVTALDAVIAVAAPDAVIAVAADDRIGVLGAAHHHVFAAGETEIVSEQFFVDAGAWVIPLDLGPQGLKERIVLAKIGIRRDLRIEVYFQDAIVFGKGV